jgi:hypothetical protein
MLQVTCKRVEGGRVIIIDGLEIRAYGYQPAVTGTLSLHLPTREFGPTAPAPPRRAQPGLSGGGLRICEMQICLGSSVEVGSVGSSWEISARVGMHGW